MKVTKTAASVILREKSWCGTQEPAWQLEILKKEVYKRIYCENSVLPGV